MRLLTLTTALILSGLVFLAACSSLEDAGLGAPDTDGGGTSAGPEFGMAILDWGWVDLQSTEAIDKYSRASLVVFETQALWSGNFNAGAIAAMKTQNPDVKVLGYFNAHGSWLYWSDADKYPAGSYGGDWYAATKPYWSATTTGDTMMSWPGKVLLDILDPACRTAMVGVIADHWEAHQNVFDGILWDHFNHFLWVPLELAGREGDLDLDHDGIAHRDDEDEMAAYRLASEALIGEVRAVLGDRVIQVANGSRAPQDSVFAGLVDGMMYEKFPSYAFSGERMTSALDPAVYNNLFAARNWPRSRNGGPYLLLSNKYHLRYITEDGDLESFRLAEFNRLAALMTDNLVVFHSEDETYRYGWPDQEYGLGAPLGGIVIEGTTMTRSFEHGEIWLEMTSGNMPTPFNFQVSKNGVTFSSPDINLSP